jgi:alkylhydroperoxidase family enzyme
VALLEFVETVTLAPFLIAPGHWDALRAHDWSDREIARAAVGSAHFNYLNRVADGVGIRLDYPTSLGLELAPRDAPAARPSRDPVHTAPDARDGGAPADADAPALFAALHFLPAAAAIVREWRAHHLAGTPALPEALRARLAVYGAALAFCPPSLASARRRAELLGVSAAALDTLAAGDPDATSDRERALFAQTRRLLLEPGAVREEHVDALRAHGLDDRDVLQLTELAGYLSFEHRTVLALAPARA